MLSSSINNAAAAAAAAAFWFGPRGAGIRGLTGRHEIQGNQQRILPVLYSSVSCFEFPICLLAF